MFGTLKPDRHTSCSGRREYRRSYCGTCAALGDGYGLVARPLLSYEATLLTLMIESLMDSPSQPSSCRCPVNPVVHRPTLDAESPPVVVASAVQILLADQWLEDQVLDGSRSFRLLQPLTASRRQSATRRLRELGVEPGSLTRLARIQEDVESQAAVSVASALEPTAAALGELAEQFGQLPGVTPRLSGRSASLRALGRGIGAAVYLIDALEDLARDLKKGRFNPLVEVAADGKRGACERRLLEAARLAEQAAGAVSRALADLPWQRNVTLLESILVASLGRRLEQAMARAEACLLGRGERVRRSIELCLPEPQFALATASASVGGALMTSQVPPPPPSPAPPPPPPVGHDDSSGSSGKKRKKDDGFHCADCCFCCDDGCACIPRGRFCRCCDDGCDCCDCDCCCCECPC